MSLILLFALQTLLGEKFVSDVKSGSSSETDFIFIVGFLLLGEAQTGRSLWVKKRRECSYPEGVEDKSINKMTTQSSIMSSLPSRYILAWLSSWAELS